MTLSVGVLCRSVEPLSRTFGLVLASDTRYSYANSAPYDQGEKVFELGPFSGCAAAATNAEHVFRAVEALRPVFRPRLPISSVDARDAVGDVLGKLDDEIRSRGEEPGYHLILATYTRDGTAVLICVGDEDQVDGQETYLDWGVAIGVRDYAGAFDEALRAGIERTLAMGNDLLAAGDQALAVGVALHECVKQELHPGIGGGIQIALITPERGYQRLQMSLWDRRTNRIEVMTPNVSRDRKSRPLDRYIPVDLIRLAEAIEEDENGSQDSFDPAGQ